MTQVTEKYKRRDDILRLICLLLRRSTKCTFIPEQSLWMFRRHTLFINYCQWNRSCLSKKYIHYCISFYLILFSMIISFVLGICLTIFYNKIIHDSLCYITNESTESTKIWRKIQDWIYRKLLLFISRFIY